MNDILKVMPEWALGIGAIFVLLFGAFLIIKNKMQIKFRGIKVGDDEDHMYLIISKAIQLSNEERDIKIKLRSDEQMRYTRTKSDDVYAALMRNYRQLLKEKGVTDPLDSREYKIYSQNVELMLNKVVLIFYDYFEEMHADSKLNNSKNVDFCIDYIRKDYEIFRSNAINAIIQRGTDMITDRWVQIDAVTRDEVHEYNDPIMVNIENVIGDVLDKAINIQLSYSRRIAEIGQELKDYIEKVKSGEEL